MDATNTIVYLKYFASAALAGDYNRNGKVDAADYVKWRKNPGNFGGTPGGYNTWRANFGKPPGSGSSLGRRGQRRSRTVDDRISRTVRVGVAGLAASSMQETGHRAWLTRKPEGWRGNQRLMKQVENLGNEKSGVHRKF